MSLINKNSKIIFGLLLIFILIAVSAYYDIVRNDNSEVDEVKYLIGIAQANLQEDWRIEVNKAIMAESEKHENMRVIFTDAQNDSEKQISDIHNLLNRGVDLLIISPKETENLKEEITAANRIVPVILIDREVKGSEFSMYIGTDNREIGRRAGEYVIEYLENAEGNLLEIIGQEDSQISQEISSGFNEVISQYPNIKILDTISGDWLKDKTEDTLKQIILDYSKVDVIFAHNDEMALGAYRAAEKMRVPNICYIGIGGLTGKDGGVQLVEEGILNCTFSDTTARSKVIDYAIKILENEEIPNRVIIQSHMITKEKLVD